MRHLHFGKVGDLAELYGQYDPVPVTAEDLGMSNEHKQSDRQPLKLFISHATVDEFLAGPSWICASRL